MPTPGSLCASPLALRRECAFLLVTLRPPAYTRPLQVPLCVSLGSLMLCAALNWALQRYWKQPAVSANGASARWPRTRDTNFMLHMSLPAQMVHATS